MIYALDERGVWHIVLNGGQMRCQTVPRAVIRTSTDVVAVERSKKPWCAGCDATLSVR